MKTLVISDCHLGVKRQGGTTKESRELLDSWLIKEFKNLFTISHDDVVILGDLFDTRNVSETIMLEVINTLKEEESVHLVLGNHDIAGYFGPDLSSAEFVAKISGANLIDSPRSGGGWHFIPHCFNQEEFNKCLAEVPENALVFLHCNYNNSFNPEADHSLNLSKEAADELLAKGCRIIMGHEHAARDLPGITILGCSAPTSIADCLGGSKRCAIIEDGEISFVETWNQSNFLNIDYTELHEVTEEYKFVRINGECELVEFPAITRSIANIRKKSDAFIIANKVKVKAKEGIDQEQQEVTTFNIIELLMSNIDEAFKEDVAACI